jgi:hypothetical protein
VGVGSWLLPHAVNSAIARMTINTNSAFLDGFMGPELLILDLSELGNIMLCLLYLNGKSYAM